MHKRSIFLVVFFALIVMWAVSPVVKFAATFEILGLPVIRPKHGWLGPTPRGSQCVHDIGKVNEWTCDDISVFTDHRFSCQLWLETFVYE